MKTLKILLIGQPNVGKSSLVNAIVGSRVTVSNYPGTTVEVAEAWKKIHDTEIRFIDTPGIYSISDKSEEEKVTEKAIFEEKVDGAIVVADATSLERSLYIALQILEAEIPFVLAINFVEDAEKKGIKIDYKKLEDLLYMPVVPINPLTRKGVNNLIEKVINIKNLTNPGFKVIYDDHIEKALEELTPYIENDGKLPVRFIALRILEEDEDFFKYLKDKKIINRAKEILKEHPKVAEDIAITRYGTASFIAGKVTRITSLALTKKKKKFEERFDSIILHKLWGPIITFFSLLLIFALLLYLGNLVQGFFMELTNDLSASLKFLKHSMLSIALSQSLTGLAAGISIAFPYVLLFYLILGLLEDTGLLSRFIVNTERFLRKIGLPAKSFIPLALGLGCTAAATRSTRVLSTKKEQFYTASLFAFVPCSSRIAIIMGIVGFYGGRILALYVFATLAVAGLIWSFVIKKTIHIKHEPLLLELPPYRKPMISNVLAKSWLRMKDFVYIVMPLLAIGGMSYGILNSLKITQYVASSFSIISSWLDLPDATVIPLFFGFLQKDLTGGMLISAMGTTDLSTLLTPLQIYIFGTAATVGIPCINALVMFIKEFGVKNAVGLTAASIIYGFLLSGLLWRAILLVGRF